MTTQPQLLGPQSNEAYRRQGGEAFALGLPYDACPYYGSSEAGMRWARGYRAARYLARRAA